MPYSPRFLRANHTSKHIYLTLKIHIVQQIVYKFLHDVCTLIMMKIMLRNERIRRWAWFTQWLII